MTLPSRIETVVVGAGQAGLSMSSFLRRAGRDHVVLERRATLGGGWRDRWDSFCLVSPNWTTALPEYPYEGDQPHAFMPRDQLVARTASYAAAIGAPVLTEAGVRRLTMRPAGGFRLETDQGTVEADRVVVTTGSFHTPRIPPIAAELPRPLAQLHSHAYRNDSSLPPGAVLVVGSGQTGMQLAEELADAGRRVFLSVGTAGQAPRRYRGRDIFGWIIPVASRGPAYDVVYPTVGMLKDPRMRMAGNPHLSGHGGGHDTNLREFAMRGMTLLGRLDKVEGSRIRLAPDLSACLGAADAFFPERWQPLIDQFIERSGLEAPPDDRVPIAYEPPVLSEIDIVREGITSVLWTSGYSLDFGWVDLPILDGQGFPRQVRGVSEVPGLAFLGLLWQHTQGSATLFGPKLDGPHLARQLGLPIEDLGFDVPYQ